MKVKFATTNPHKFAIAKGMCEQAGIELEQIFLDIDEIQGEDPEKIAKDKVRRAFEVVQAPVIVSDDSWTFNALNGFPGPYMKSINKWFSSEDFVKLFDNYSDRSVMLHEYLVYTDGAQEVLISADIAGTVLPEPRGQSDISWRQVVSMEFDEGNSLAELDNLGIADSPERVNKYPAAWHEMISWLKKQG